MSEGHQAADHPSGVTEAQFLLWREVDRLDGRINSIQRVVSHLDEHGTRGIEQLRAQVTMLVKEFGEHETTHKEQAAAVLVTRRWNIGLMVTLVVPLYPFLYWVLEHVAG